MGHVLSTASCIKGNRLGSNFYQHHNHIFPALFFNHAWHMHMQYAWQKAEYCISNVNINNISWPTISSQSTILAVSGIFPLEIITYIQPCSSIPRRQGWESREEEYHHCPTWFFFLPKNDGFENKKYPILKFTCTWGVPSLKRYLVLKIMSCQESPIEYRNSMASPPPVHRMDWAAEEINMFAPANIANIANIA